MANGIIPSNACCSMAMRHTKANFDAEFAVFFIYCRRHVCVGVKLKLSNSSQLHFESNSQKRFFINSRWPHQQWEIKSSSYGTRTIIAVARNFFSFFLAGCTKCVYLSRQRCSCAFSGGEKIVQAKNNNFATGITMKSIMLERCEREHRKKGKNGHQDEQKKATIQIVIKWQKQWPKLAVIYLRSLLNTIFAFSFCTVSCVCFCPVFIYSLFFVFGAFISLLARWLCLYFSDDFQFTFAILCSICVCEIWLIFPVTREKC